MARKVISDLNIDGARFYPILEADIGKGPLWVPSVTTALDVWPKPALVTWSASSEKQGILGDLETWLHDDTEANRGAMLARILKLRAAPLCYREASRAACDLGSSAHAWLEWSLREIMGARIGPEPALLPGAEKVVKGATEWMKAVNLEPIDIERRVYDAKTGYAGRYDLKARVDWDLPDGAKERRIVIVDWKSSKGVYPDMFVQNIAYRQADAITANGNRSKGGMIVRLAKTEDDPVPFEAVQVPFNPAAFDLFVSALTFWRNWRQYEGKWCGGFATEEEIKMMQAGRRKKPKAADAERREAMFQKAGL